MAPHAIISYDDTPNDQDALVLGQLLAGAGARLTLAYVSHRTKRDEHAAWDLLERGALWLDDIPEHVDRRVVMSASTGEGLKWLALQECADLIVFGSDYRTAAGHVSPGRSAQTLLEGGPAALAIAPADFREHRDGEIRTIGLLADPGDDATLETARELAGALDATVTRDEPQVDLLVVGSRSEAPHGQLLITAAAANAVENATCPVLIVARGVPIEFGSLVGA
ncbi:MAG TPA: universal stress protein [Solirubrobacteraceae bacterium]|jgi:nucleotide-binding universal stress UspA family protein|nr:universal stress protein [Solirubrobacteraceae bacterium]